MFKKINSILIIIIGCLIAGFGTSCFLLPNKLSSGGFSGISTILYYFYNINMSTSILIMNIPLIAIGYYKLGKGFVFRTILGIFLYSLFIDLFTQVKPFTEDRFLASIYGGILIGIGLALVFRTSTSTGGSDLIAYIVQSYNRNIRIGKFLVTLDAIIIILNLIFFKEIEIGLYSFISIFLISKMTDIIFEGINFSKMIYIISDKYEEIENKIIKESDKGLTSIYAKGGYKKNDKMIVMCVTKRNYIMKIKSLAHEIDRDAFIIITDVREVYGLGFKEEK
ncbi:MAG: YitT family protein [Clostridia bacterium]|nr:YitT family protein [Clostridia bacterium]